MSSVEHQRGPEWSTPFAQFIAAYERGVLGLLEDLAREGWPVHKTAVYHWVAADSSPRPAIAMTLVSLSRGKLTLSQIYQHAVVVRAARDAEAQS